MEARKEEEVEAAMQAADSALKNAKEIRERGVKIGAGWRQSRSDNNFRQMLRILTAPTTTE